MKTGLIYSRGFRGEVYDNMAYTQRTETTRLSYPRHRVESRSQLWNFNIWEECLINLTLQWNSSYKNERNANDGGPGIRNSHWYVNYLKSYRFNLHMYRGIFDSDWRWHMRTAIQIQVIATNTHISIFISQNLHNIK